MKNIRGIKILLVYGLCLFVGWELADFSFKVVVASGVLSIPATVVQTNKSNAYTTGTQDFSLAVHTVPAIVVANVPALPSTGCLPGEWATVTGATLGQQMYQNSGTGPCTWTQQLNTGSSSGGGFGGYSSAAAVPFSGTQFFPIVGGGAPSGTETNVDVDSPAAATMKNLYVQLASAPGMGNSLTLTMRQNAADTSLTCAVSGASATVCNDTTHSFNVSQGDLITLKAVTSGVIVGSINLTFTYQFGNITSTGSVNTGTINQTGVYSAGGSALSGSDNLSIRSFGAAFDGSGTALTAGKTSYVTVPYACNIAAYNITADTGTVSFDVWRLATGTAIPTVANTIINGSNYLSLSSGTAVHTAVSGGTPFTSRAIAANDILGINIQAVSGATALSIVFQCGGIA